MLIWATVYMKTDTNKGYYDPSKAFYFQANSSKAQPILHTTM